MTELEQQSFEDGFRICLLCVNADRRRNALAFHAVLFDGGREVDVTSYEGPFFADPTIFLRLRTFLVRVAASPHVLATHGRGASLLLEDTLSDHLPAYRILDVQATAKILLPNRPSTRQEPAEAVDIEGCADLLWAVVADGGQRGFDWPALLAATESATLEVAFHHYLFNEITLLTVPRTPGVYLMRDAVGAILYVGKAADLNRRLHAYFRRSRELPAKLQTLRDRIHDFEVLPVGSELEALLLENRLIHQHQPDVNIQRRVAEGRSRYAAPLLPIVLLQPSSARHRVELFCFAPNHAALQLRFNPKRPAKRALQRLLVYTQGRAATPPRASTVTDWGRTGAELCVRYFGRQRTKLQWIELSGEETEQVWIERLITLATTVLANPAEAIAFRE